MMPTYDKIFKSEEYKEKKYQLASGYISTTTVFFEAERIGVTIEAKGGVVFFDGEGTELAAVKMPVQSGGREVYEDVVCSTSDGSLVLRFPIVKWIDNYPHCDGEHDRWDSEIIGWHTLVFDPATKATAIATE